MSYNEIVVPSESDGSKLTLVGGGYFRGVRVANVGWRIAAALVDYGVVYLLYLIGLVVNMVYYRLTAVAKVDLSGLDFLVSGVIGLIPWVVFIGNSIVMQARSGQSFGKMLFGMIVVSPKVDPTDMNVAWFAKPSGLLMVGRTLLHFVDSIAFVGVALIALSNRNESLADRVCNTLVLRPLDLNALELHEGLIGARDR